MNTDDLTFLRQFYTDLRDAADSRIGQACREMCNFLSKVEPGEIGDEWVCKTSHQTLCFSRSAYPGTVVVTMTPLGYGTIGVVKDDSNDDEKGTFEIQYKIPDRDEPWPDSWVRMSAQNVSDAMQVLHIALSRCAR